MSVVDTTDSEDSPRPAVKKGLKASGSGQPSQLTVVGGSYSNLSPMIIMNNVLLKQVRRQNAAILLSCNLNPNLKPRKEKDVSRFCFVCMLLSSKKMTFDL